MPNPESKKLLRVGIVGTVLVALCCFTPILLILFGAVGLAAFTGYLDVVLLPALAAFVGLTIYALVRRQKAQTCTPQPSGEKK